MSKSVCGFDGSCIRVGQELYKDRSDPVYNFYLLVILGQEHRSVGWTFVHFKYACDLNSQDGAHPGLSMFNDVCTEDSYLDKILTSSCLG